MACRARAPHCTCSSLLQKSAEGLPAEGLPAKVIHNVRQELRKIWAAHIGGAGRVCCEWIMRYCLMLIGPLTHECLDGRRGCGMRGRQRPLLQRGGDWCRFQGQSWLQLKGIAGGAFTLVTVLLRLMKFAWLLGAGEDDLQGIFECSSEAAVAATACSVHMPHGMSCNELT